MRANVPQNFYSLCIAASGGSSGKTALSLGLGRSLARRGFIVQPFKKGPDYIDAAWLADACGQSATNLDPFFQDAQGLAQSYAAALARSVRPGKPQFALVEGNRGLYDGLDAAGSCSTAMLARMLNLPILLCLNAAKASRTIAALVQGLVNFESGLHFLGLILNNVGSARHEKALCNAILANCDLPLLGVLPRLKQNPIPERHMGLRSPAASLAEETDKIFENLANWVERHCNVDTILALSAAPGGQVGEIKLFASAGAIESSNAIRPVIGYCRDAAFWFYYPENLEALVAAGARLVELSPLAPFQAEKWQIVDGLYLGGGFPEDYAQALSQSPALKFIAEKAEQGLPIYAECGGLALLCAQLRLEDARWPMGGIFNADLVLRKKPQGLGYVEGTVCAKNSFFPLGQLIKGHEFHYSICEKTGETTTALRLKRGQGLYEGKNRVDALIYKNVWASYTHIFAPALPGWAPAFVAAARKWRHERKV